MSPRLAAVHCLTQVVREGESLSRALPRALEALQDGRERALVQALCYGALRWHHRYSACLGVLMDKPLRRKDTDVECVLRLGLYQIEHLRMPDYAVVDESVKAAQALRKSWAGRLVNAVLRNFLRQRQTLEARIADDPQARFSHPAWLIERLRAAYPGHWEAVCEENNARAPMCLRVNRMQGTVEDYRRTLRDAGIEAATHPHAGDALILAEPVDVRELPGFAQGRASVQDAAAQLAADMMDCRPGMRVLDACAAPGGKTAHLLERTGGELALQAVDSDAERMRRVEESLARLGLRARLSVADAADPGAWWDGTPYERILLDAPCSATGVIRRHPDIKLHRQARDIPALAAGQARLLERLWPLLKPGGRLVYATCSVLPEENTRVLERFIAANRDTNEEQINAKWGHACATGRQILPGEARMDGFYYACLSKRE